ncbi:MAG: transcription-repair coupling factor [Solobacterium sp.]|nr:transcription-repair coupling factor [Solobacterium sp.]MCH4221868.1 transcription-repair coupling factor [Solobacterium sp.]MCH4265191.1 transcription-repair coupling factor [Solobacterium sp.]
MDNAESSASVGIPGALQELLNDSPAVALLNSEHGTLPLPSLMEEALVISTSYLQHPRPILVIKQNLYSAQRLYDRISTLLSEAQCALFAADESLRVEAIASSPEMTAAKVETLSSLLEHPSQVVITCPSGVLRHLPYPSVFQSGCISLTVGEEMNMEELKRHLRAGGYYETAHIDQPLSFAARGGIVDIYSINYEQPIRIEFFGDEIDSIRFFDVATQKTVLPIQQVKIVPASEVLFSPEEIEEITGKVRTMLEEQNDDVLSDHVESDLQLLESDIRQPQLYPYTSFLSRCGGLWDYMDHPLVVWSDYSEIEGSAKRLNEDTVSYIQEMVQEKKLPPKYSMWHELTRIAPDSKQMKEDPFADNISNLEELHLPEGSLEQKLSILHNGREKILFCLHDQDVERIVNLCVEQQYPYQLMLEGSKIQTGFNIAVSPLMEGFALPHEHLSVVTATELFAVHRHTGRYDKKFRNAEVIHGSEELSPGDYVVHAQYGVGQYMGIDTREIQGVMCDFLRIIYRGNAELLVPLKQFGLVRKFVSREGVVPKLNKLGSGDWEKTRARLEEDVSDIAERLVTLYSNREQHIGYAYQPDSELQKEFEASFEYELTPDQAKAVQEIKKDMESSKPMDRLVCGDVGFGKTEVAVRAAFKAAAENKQVAMLCPTTILAEQHFRTFIKRFEGYPFTVRVLDRFVQPSVQAQIIKELKDGTIDILIGTHRILSKDVQFKDLGLLIVDEEQRFGVEHKEKIKEMKNGIDVLALSATPIPRTLQMSLVGIRSLSQLETPPVNRYSVQTYVVEKNEGLIGDAIEKELARNGQVFYLYNNIEQIYNVTRRLQNLIPEAKIGIAHGKMDRDEIEDVMMRFNNRELNVLVCTTIIENGIDIPNVNTIIIDNAQDFGLAQIYQIKGRVGRSDRVAYAYLMVPPRKQLSETASKRLQAVKEFARLGSGYKIAMRDLTIRGAGDLLGENQSGFIDTVGIDMYIEMLEEAIEKKKGIVKEVKPERKQANVHETSYIPHSFAPDDYDKIGLYQKIDAVENVQQLDDYRNEIIDQYGKLPSEVSAVFDKKHLDILINDPDVQGYREKNGESEVTFSPLFSNQVDGVKLFEIFSKLSKDIGLRYTNQCIIASLPKQKDSLMLVIQMIEQAKGAKRS